jgi:hypothetical protein
MERLKFTREFKIEAVKLIQERGVTVAQASRDFVSFPVKETLPKENFWL